MPIFNNLFYSLLSFFIFSLSGLGLAMLITPKGLKKYTLFFSPLLGYCYIVLAGWHLATFGIKPEYNENGLIYSLNSVSRLNFGGTDSHFGLVFILPVFLFALALYKNRQNLKIFADYKNRDLIAPLVVGIFAFILLSVPLFRHGDGLSVISVRNHDIIDSALKSRFLKEFSLSDTVGYLSHIDPLQNYNFLKHDVMTNRFGTPYAAAFLSSVFHLEAYQMQMIVMTVLFFAGIVLFYVFLREVFIYDQFPALMIAALFALSPIMYYLIYQGFQPQVVGMILTVGFFLLQFYVIKESSKFSDYVAYILILALFSWGISSTYAHMLPIIYIPIIAYLVVQWVNSKSVQNIAGWLVLQIAALFLTTVFSPFRMKVLLANLLLHASIEAGWDMPYFWPDYILGVNYLSVSPPLTIFGYPIEFKPLLGLGENQMFFHLIFSLPVIAAISIGLSRVFKENRRVFLISVSCLAVIIGGYNYIYFFTPVSAKYKSFKLLSFFLPFILPVFCLIFNKVRNDKKNSILGYTLILLVAGNIIAALIFAGYSFNGRYVNHAMAEIKKIESMPQIESVNIMGYDWWEAMWMNVFLMKKKQYFQMTTYSGRNSNNVTDGQWDIFNMSSYGFPPEECKNDVIVVNFPYGLVRASRLDAEAMRAEIRISDLPEGISPEAKVPVNLRIKNISSRPWPLGCNPMRMLHLAYAWIDEEGKKVLMGGRPLMRALNPGEEIPLNVEIIAPRKPGPYSLVFDILQENVAWFADRGSRPLALHIEVR